MFFIELFVPKGTLCEEQRRHLCERIANELVKTDDDHPMSTLEAALASTHVIVHEPDQWVVGGRAIDPTEPPHFIVRATVPGAWRKEMSEHLIALATRVLAEADENPQRLYEEAHAWVYVMGVPEGGSGTMGDAMKSSDILRMITKSYREASTDSLPAREIAPGTAIDPICGMVAPLVGDHAIILEHEGTTYAFCSHGCRALFTEELNEKLNDSA